MRKKKYCRKIPFTLAIVTAFAVAVFLGGCGNQEKAVPEENVDYEIALVTDDGLIMDGGHSEVAWNTITEFGATNGISHKYYKAAEPSESAFIETIKTAIGKGAKIVIIDNSTMQDVAYKMQEEYPEIKFVLTDADPYEPETGDIRLDTNTVALAFDSGQAGFLAGYAAVTDGYTQLGFIGESSEDEIRDFGYGYIKGANRAAREMGVEVYMDYVYCKDSQDRDAVYETAEDMYDNGAEVIFSAGNNIDEPVIDAAEVKDKEVIGSIADQIQKSDKVITSAIYHVDNALKEVLGKYSDGEFPGGEVLVYNAHNDGIGLELKNNRLNSMTQGQYDAVYDELASGDIKVNTDDIESIKEINAPNVVIK